MPTTLNYAQLSDIPEGLRDAATEKDGKYTISVEPAAKVKEFRDNNVAISQERDNLKGALSRYEQVTGVPVEAVEEGSLEDFAKVLTNLKETKARVDDGALVENTSLEEAAAKRVAEAHESYRKQLAESAKDRDAHRERADAAERRANQMLVENAIRLAASDPEVAMLDKAVSMVLPQAQTIFQVDTGEIVPKSVDGTVIYGSDGMTPMSIKEWLMKQREENDFLFRGARGGGAQGGTSTEGGKMTFDQMQKAGIRPEERMRLARAGK